MVGEPGTSHTMHHKDERDFAGPGMRCALLLRRFTTVMIARHSLSSDETTAAPILCNPTALRILLSRGELQRLVERSLHRGGPNRGRV